MVQHTAAGDQENDSKIQGAALSPSRFTETVKHALAAGEFTLAFQPQADVRTGRIIGCEALSRWQQADGTCQRPDLFIREAEDGDAILAIGEWALRTACQQMADWHAQDLIDFPISVNLSARQLAEPGLTRQIVGILNETALPASCLTLELTETSLLDDDPAVVETLLALRALGIGLELDDFGTGYASLALLTRLPLTGLKIDKRFIQAMTADRTAAVIVQSIIALAHNLALVAVAEGVETSEQHLFLQAYGCDRLQGYWLARPLTADHLAAFIKANRLIE